MRASLTVFVMNILCVIFLSPILHADHMRGPAATDTNSMRGTRLQTIIPGSLDSTRKQVIRELVSAQTPQLNWPPFPRVWLERSVTEVKTSNTAMGLKIPIVNSGAKVSVEYKYGLKTSLIVVSSKRKSDMYSDLLDEATPLNDAREESQIIRYDEYTNTTYPNVRDEFPMVGLCVFEASLNIEKSKNLSFDFIGFSQSVKNGTVEVISQSIFSNFFQLNSSTSLNHYVKNICGQVFRKNVERSIIDDFSKMVVEKLVTDNPSSQCQPVHSENLSDSDLAKGDSTCLMWHRSNYTEIMQKITVPRCELQVNGAHQCVLKARPGTACNMFIDPKTQKYADRFARESYRIRATKDAFAYDCDAQQGLTCELYDKPTLLLGLPFFEGRAQCVKK